MHALKVLFVVLTVPSDICSERSDQTRDAPTFFAYLVPIVLYWAEPLQLLTEVLWHSSRSKSQHAQHVFRNFLDGCRDMPCHVQW